MTGPMILRRVVASVTVLVALATAFAAGLLVADGRGDQPSYRLTGAGLDSGLTCDRVRQWYVDHGVERVTAWGWQGPMYRGPLVPQVAAPGTAADASGSTSDPQAGLDTTTGSSTGTNVQEAGVDEPDIAKVSGDLLVRIHRGVLETDDVSGPAPRWLGVTPLDRLGDPMLLLSGDHAVVIGTWLEDPTAGAPMIPPPPRTWVRTFDLADPSHPTLVDSRLYDGSLVTARQVGSTVRLVLEGGLPTLDFETPSGWVSETAALAHNREVVRESTVEDWLPGVTSYAEGAGRRSPLVDCSQVAVPETFNGLGTLTVVGFDATAPAHTDATAVATSSDTAYMSPTHLYVAASPWSAYAPPGPLPMMPVDGSRPTRIYGFNLTGTSARYVGMGSVDGTVTGSWSMDEHDGVLRVAVRAGSPDAATSIRLLRSASGRLVEVGHLDGLGAGQQLMSVRWFDDLAVLVTYRQTDPFYVVDLTDPTSPRVLGALHLPGWSSYLHPVAPHLLLGLGQTSATDVFAPPAPEQTLPTPLPPPTVPAPPKPAPGLPNSGTATAEPVDPPIAGPEIAVPLQRGKATLFDISDHAHPRDVDTVSYPGGSVPMAATQPHQVTWLPDRRVLLTVVSGYGVWGGTAPHPATPVPPAWVSVLTVRDGSLGSRLVPVADPDVNEIRTLPLGDGRVVLVAGDSVRFLGV
ncbi:beta-propeller domain-containing protein [Nocardioides sp.]|uniref:beta-propeller domain-containing protein n=1 Tax=Nocardioides sp. TaxID=35761 RepID=UPI002F3FAE87